VRLLLILRTAICLEVGLSITFTQSHNVLVGLAALTSFGVGYAMVSVFVALLQRKKLSAYDTLPLTAAALAVGLLAAQAPTADGLTWFRYLVAGWGLFSGLFEVVLARRAGFKTLRGRESLVSAVLALILGILFLAVNLKALDEVGFFGAYMMICAVHLGISAASDRSSKQSA